MQLTEIPLNRIRVSGSNARHDLTAGQDDADIEGLAASIAEQGLLNPPTMRATSDGWFEVIAGQRRVAAFRLLDRATIPSILRDLDETRSLTMSLVENVQRADMAPLDKARAFKHLVEQHGSIAATAKQTGTSPSTVQKYLRLVTLPGEILADLGSRTGPGSVSYMAELARRFPHPDDALRVHGQVEAFSSDIAERIVRDSGGDLDAIADLVDAAIAGRLDRFRCGSSLATCPHLPAETREQILRIAGEPPE